MRKIKIAKPSPALFISCLSLFVALSGVGYAAVVLPKNSVGTAQLKPGAVRNADIYGNAVNGAKIANGSVTGADVNEPTIGKVPSAANADNAAALGGAPAADYAKVADALTQTQANDLYLAKTGKAADAETLDGSDSTAFASAGHNHDANYYTKPQSDSRYARVTTAQTWGAAQYFFQGLSVNAVARTGNYSMTSTDSAVFMSPSAAGQWVELPCATTVGAGRIVAVKKMNTLYSIYVAACPPGIEKIDNASTITLPAAYRGAVIFMSRGTSNGWVILASHGPRRTERGTAAHAYHGYAPVGHRGSVGRSDVTRAIRDAATRGRRAEATDRHPLSRHAG